MHAIGFPPQTQRVRFSATASSPASPAPQAPPPVKKPRRLAGTLALVGVIGALLGYQAKSSNSTELARYSNVQQTNAKLGETVSTNRSIGGVLPTFKQVEDQQAGKALRKALSVNVDAAAGHTAGYFKASPNTRKIMKVAAVHLKTPDRVPGTVTPGNIPDLTAEETQLVEGLVKQAKVSGGKVANLPELYNEFADKVLKNYAHPDLVDASKVQFGDFIASQDIREGQDRLLFWAIAASLVSVGAGGAIGLGQLLRDKYKPQTPAA